MEPPDDQACMTSSCPYCQGLHLEVAPCPRCDGKPRFQAAQMLDKTAIGQAVARTIDAYDNGRQRLDTLLQVLFLHRPVAGKALQQDGRLCLERLRRDDAELPS
ncbi:MAG: hypothetical protein ACI89X_000269 [Planctomycetota bacterium]|jgi:hypothetical protein